MSTEHREEGMAQNMADLLTSLRDLAEPTLKGMDSAPEIEKLLGLLREVNIEAEGTICTVRLAVHDLSADELFRLLRRAPLQ